ncbi:MAG: hypothetical protein JSV80_01505 [Acidobacteriota bacterium]|nr:MAG: hypothetical protein JSV80_01505 [Acidobacteriota bacterium]
MPVPDTSSTEVFTELGRFTSRFELNEDWIRIPLPTKLHLSEKIRLYAAAQYLYSDAEVSTAVGETTDSLTTVLKIVDPGGTSVIEDEIMLVFSSLSHNDETSRHGDALYNLGLEYLFNRHAILSVGAFGGGPDVAGRGEPALDRVTAEFVYKF